MITLGEAWDWYSSTRSCLLLFARIGRRHWESFPDDSPLWRDDAFRQLQSNTIARDTDLGLEHLDDLAVMVFFSAFEAIVRERVLAKLQAERDRILGQIAGDREDVGGKILAGVVDASVEEIRKKAFHRVLEIFKAMDAGLVEEVNQVRRYRNWVAHGRRSERPTSVDPTTAHERLTRFLETMTDG